MAYVSSSGTATPTVDGQRLTWDLGTVPGQPDSGSEGYQEVRVRVSDLTPIGTELCNRVDILTSEPETGLQSNDQIVCHDVVTPTRDLNIYKYLSSGNPGAPGGWMEYEVEFRNEGNATAAERR